jgi:hypothetical protein
MPLDRRKITHICKQFSSDNEHVRSAAALQADRLITAAGLTWEDIFATLPRASIHQPSSPPHREERANQGQPKLISGGDIPGTLTGQIRVLTEGPPLTISVTMGATEYGPITVRGHHFAATAREQGYRIRQVRVQRSQGDDPPVVSTIL